MTRYYEWSTSLCTGISEKYPKITKFHPTVNCMTIHIEYNICFIYANYFNVTDWDHPQK